MNNSKTRWDKYLNPEILERVRSALADEESLALFNARLEWFVTRDDNAFYEVVDSFRHEWKCEELDGVAKDAELIIYGCGVNGREAYQAFSRCGRRPAFYCDSNAYGSYVDGLYVLSPVELKRDHSDAVVVVGSKKCRGEIYGKLLDMGFARERIIRFRGEHVSTTGKTYFDFFGFGQNEVFVDAGAFDGKTILEFIEAVGGTYDKIYTLEPQPEMCETVQKLIEKQQLSNVNLVKCAAWNQKEILHFQADNTEAGCVTDSGAYVVQGLAIDDIVDAKDAVSFIKMDIEGSELRALEGARQTIKRCKPKMAICIYHKPEDVLTLTSYILELVPEYKMGIRHYSSNMWETVLYCYI